MSVMQTKSSQVAKISASKVETRSPMRIAIRRYLQHRLAVVGAILLIVIILICTIGAAFFDEAAGNKTNIMNKMAPPDSEHIFGTDLVGRDILVRTIYGGQISIAIGIISVAISITVGTAVGVIGGFLGGVIDGILSRFTEALLSIPTLILLLVLSSVLSKTTGNMNILGRQLSGTVVVIVLLIGLTSWMQLSRIVRAQVLSLKEQEFILAARAIGVGNAGIIVRHLLPNLIAPIVVSATLGIGGAIITEAYLSFLGFGVLPPTATWGNILNGAQDRIDTVWWMWMIPGFFIVATVMAINYIGDGLRDALDPRSIR